MSMESTPPPKRTGTENEIKKGVEIKAEIGGVKEVILKITELTYSCSNSGILMLLYFYSHCVTCDGHDSLLTIK